MDCKSEWLIFMNYVVTRVLHDNAIPGFAKTKQKPSGH